MSKSPFKSSFLHLTFSESSGFQYYRDLPLHFKNIPGMPMQIRWALGADEILARELAAQLNHRFDFCTGALSPEVVRNKPKLAIQELIDIRRGIKSRLNIAGDAWRGLPTPSDLAKSDSSLQRGFDRLQADVAKHPVLYTKDTGEIVFALTASPQLCAVFSLLFERFDWPLGTADIDEANASAIYICAAIDVLETAHLRNDVYDGNPFSFPVLAFYEYLMFARRDGGAGIRHIPDTLPQAVQSLVCRPFPIDSRNPLSGCMPIVQAPNGLYVLELDLTRLDVAEAIKQRRTLRLDLLTSSPIVAWLLYLHLLPALFQLGKSWLLGASGSSSEFDRSVQEMADLIRRTIHPLPPAEPMVKLPECSSSPTEDVNLDPTQKALVNALGALIPPEKKRLLERLMFEAKSPGTLQPNSKRSGSLSLAELVTRYEGYQASTGSWSNPRTRMVASSRLEALCELLGGHRPIDTITRGDFLKLRDQLRQYPKNRHRIRAIRNLPLARIMERGNYEPVNLRTAKKFFELARAMMSYALDNDLIKENPGSNLTLSTKGEDAPRKRTYSTTQTQQLLSGPLYTLQSPPRWRLDDYKFWLPLMGLFTGARLSELSQLQMGEIRQELRIWVVSIRENDARQLKTVSSERLVPIHGQLIQLGFLEYYQQRLSVTKANPKAPLFENVRVYGKLAASHVASRWFLGDGQGKGGYLALCGLSEDRLTFHGLRHTFINQFRRQQLDLLIAKALVGHVDRSTTGGYGDTYPTTVLKAEIDKVDFGVDISHIHYNRYRKLQEAQGVFRAGRPVNRWDVLQQTPA